jgi:hypothetical protein
VPPEVRARWQEEVNRNVLRMKHFSEMVMNPKEPEVGPTPRQEIYRKNKSRLYRYESRRTHRTPCSSCRTWGSAARTSSTSCPRVRSSST